MMNWWKNGKAKSNRYANPSGRLESKDSCHAQRIGAETVNADYNAPTSHRHLEQVMMYAELIGNYKSQGIKSLWGNILDVLYGIKQLDDERVVSIS